MTKVLSSDVCLRRVALTIAIDIGWDEKLTGISLMRRWLLRSSHGNVLEIAAGTGKNLPYYPPKLEKVVLTDFSEPMLEELKDKKEFKQLSPEICHCTAMNADALAFADESFDTVIDTFGLCSIANVKQALQEMQRVCKRDGTILLLEHGRSHYAWLSSILDKFAGKHAHKWGCEWNRDIEKLVQDAGFEIQTIRRFHFGTTYYIIAKPTRERVAKLVRE